MYLDGKDELREIKTKSGNAFPVNSENTIHFLLKPRFSAFYSRVIKKVKGRGTEKKPTEPELRRLMNYNHLVYL
jgi:hypothetical protein